MCARVDVCMRAGGCGCTSTGVCSLTYLVCNAPPYCHLQPLWLHHIFWHYLINGKIFGKKLLNIKRVFWFFLQLLFETFLILWRIQRDTVINVKRSSCRVSVIFLRILIKLEFSRQISEKISNIKFHQNPPSGSRVLCRRTDKHDEANSRFSQFCERV